METVQELINEISRGELQLPEFQRGYVWSRDKVRSFIESLYKGRPTGHLLLWHAYRPVAVRGGSAIDGGKTLLLLDGQQRLTSLYVLFKGVPPPFYEGESLFFDLYFNMQTQEFHFYQSGLMANNPAWRSVHVLFRDGIHGILAQLGKMDPNERELVEAHLPELGKLDAVRNHRYQVDELKDESLSLDEVVEIFNKVNSAGTELSRADLAMAHVCVKWPEARKELREFAAAMELHGFRVEPEYLIRAVAGTAGETVNFTPTFNKIPAEKLQEAWPKVRKSFEYLVNILRHHAFIDSITDLPTPLVVVPMLVYLARRDCAFTSAEERDRFLRWMFLANLWSRYAGQTDTKLQRDVIGLSSEDPVNRLTEGIVADRGRLVLEAKDLEGKGPQTAIYKFAYVVARRRGAQDWFNGTTLYAKAVGKSNGLESHHIFPRDVLHKAGYGTPEARRIVNEVANRAFLTKRANLAISNRYPNVYLQKVEKNFPGALKAQCVPMEPALWKVASYERFLFARRKLLAKAMNQFLDRLAHGSTDLADATSDILGLLHQDEGALLEFKSSLRWDVREQRVNRDLEKVIVKTVAGFLNAKGGNLLIGVNDQREVTGLDADYQSLRKEGMDVRDTFLLHLTNVLANGLGEAELAFITATCHDVDRKDVCQIVIWPSDHPVYVTEGHTSIFYLRLGNLTRAIPLDQTVRYVESRWGGGPAGYVPEFAEEPAVETEGIVPAIAEGWVEGGSAFEQALEFTEPGTRVELERLYRWAMGLEDAGLLSALWSYGGTRPRLLPCPKGETVGMVTVWHDGSVSLWRSVFERCAPRMIKPIEDLSSPVPLGQGRTIRRVSNELLEALTEAYREAAEARLEATTKAAMTDADGQREPRPPIEAGLPITAYSSRDLTSLSHWIRSDGAPRTEDQMVEAMMAELGFKKRGRRIETALRDAIEKDG